MSQLPLGFHALCRHAQPQCVSQRQDCSHDGTTSRNGFKVSLRAGQRAAAITSLIQSAKLNGHDPYAYLKDVLTRLPTHKQRDIDQLLPHRWQPPSKAT